MGYIVICWYLMVWMSAGCVVKSWYLLVVCAWTMQIAAGLEDFCLTKFLNVLVSADYGVSHRTLFLLIESTT